MYDESQQASLWQLEEEDSSPEEQTQLARAKQLYQIVLFDDVDSTHDCQAESPQMTLFDCIDDMRQIV